MGRPVWVRVPPPAPRRSKLYIACSDFFSKVGAHSFRCYSFPNRTCCAVFRFGFSCEPESSCLESAHAFHASARQSPGFFIGRQGLRRISPGSAIHARIAFDIAASLCCPVVSGRSICVLDVMLKARYGMRRLRNRPALRWIRGAFFFRMQKRATLLQSCIGGAKARHVCSDSIACQPGGSDAAKP